VGDSIDDTWFDDNGEPTHSAGKVMLNVLLKQNLLRTGAFVVRYYGGINLGVGGLVKAYTTSITETLKESEIKAIEHKPQVHFNLCFEHGFALWETLKRKKWDIEVKQNDEFLRFSIMCSKDEIMVWLSTIPNSCYGEIEENLIEI
jgi:putative IMPACT (imprinted ancient) family translation regulator